MDLGLAGRTAVVTGASQGIGLAIATALNAEGVRVVGAARNITPELDSVSVSTLGVDLATTEGPARLAEHAMTTLGGVDLLVNNVGGSDAFVDFSDLDDAAWQATFELNFFSTVRLTRALLPTLRERRGNIVNVSSTAARLPVGPIDYSAAKAALTTLSRALAEHLGPAGVRVNTVSPGVTRTRLWEGPSSVGAQLAGLSGVDQSAFVDGLPTEFGITTGRLVEPAEVGAVVAWLTSDHAISMCGADIVVDGGQIKTV